MYIYIYVTTGPKSTLGPANDVSTYFVKHHVNLVAADIPLNALVIMWNKGLLACFTEQWKAVTVM